MSTIPSNLSRTATSTASTLMLANLRRTNVDLLRVNAEIASGLRVNRPSDDPTAVAGIVNLRDLIAGFDQQLRTLDRASAIVDITDQGLGEVSELITEAQSTASSQIGIISNAETRDAMADVIDGIITGLFDIANREYQDVYAFGGRQSATRPFVEQFGGIRYLGSREDLIADPNAVLPIALNTNGQSALGALSTRVQGTVDLDPDATANTRLSDVRGARDAGVTLGTIVVTVNGTDTQVDLTGADTLGDVADLINDAIGGAGSLSVTADGFTLTAGGGDTISIADMGTGGTAADLGIDLTASGGSTVGDDIGPKLTLLSDLSQLGAALDLSGGLKITNGTATTVIDTSAAATVQDLINTVNGSGLGIRMEINASQTGLNLVNEVSGTQLSIGENSGGTTASDLGLRSFAAETSLNDFNFGSGVRITEGQDDFRVELHDGTAIDVNLDGAATVQDVLDAINTAAGASGLGAALATDGNGIVLTDATAGAGGFRVLSLNGSQAAQDLGILQGADSGGTITGTDVATVRSESVFSHLVMLRDALRNDDERMITLAGEALGADVKRVAKVRAEVGVRGQRIARDAERAETRKIQTQGLLSDLRDTDYTEAISRFTQLQQQLEATLASSSRVLGLSLMDFLR
jgi:flagellin-like hook-associated protein FlgL